MWQRSLNRPYLCTVKYAVLTLSWMAFIKASSSSFCRLIATLLASCSLRWRAKSIISSSVISEDDSDRCTKSPTNTSWSILWSVFGHPTLSHRWVWSCSVSLVYVFLSMSQVTDAMTPACPERKSQKDLLIWTVKLLQRSHKSGSTVSYNMRFDSVY